MSAFSDTDFDSNRYSKSRPSYPQSFYEALSRYHKGNRNILIDVGCGPGTATFQLQEYLPFDQYVGCDMSQPMIDTANGRAQSQNLKNIHFHQGPYQDLSFLKQIGDGKCDMATCVEAVHWFDLKEFQQVVHDSLNENGTLAIWGYIDAVLVDYPEFDQYFQDLTYGDSKMGPYWDQPGKTILRNKYEAVQIDTGLFKDVERHVLTPTDIRKPGFEISKEYLPICTTMPLSGLKDYIRTWSGYHNWKHDPANADKMDLVEETLQHIIDSDNDIDSESKLVKVAWSSFYIFARKI